jgi:hypothetical protein
MSKRGAPKFHISEEDFPRETSKIENSGKHSDSKKK